jgi:hypothetical protein
LPVVVIHHPALHVHGWSAHGDRPGLAPDGTMAKKLRPTGERRSRPPPPKPTAMPFEPDFQEISDKLDESMSSDLDELFQEKLRNNRDKALEQDLIRQAEIEENEKTVEQLIDEINIAGKSGDLINPNNPSQDATEACIQESQDSIKVTVIKEKTQKIGEGLSEEEKIVLLKKLAKEGQAADNRVDQQDNPRSKWSKKQWTAAISGLLLLLGGISYLVVYFTSKTQKTPPKGVRGANGLEQVPDSQDRAEANQTFISLLMQAATDAPFSSKAFKDFGITEATYQQLREQLLDLRDNITEEAHWQIMAQQATTIFPPTGRPYSLGDHMLALDLQYNVLAPLYDEQPLDLDVDATISSLANQINLDAETPILQLYTNLMAEIPETTGANRLQRLILARMAIARVIATATPST